MADALRARGAPEDLAHLLRTVMSRLRDVIAQLG
jgi:hypothetical protein